MKLQVENAYSDGHTSTQVHDIAVEPGVGDLDEGAGTNGWWVEVAYFYTGDGHGLAHPGLGYRATATILAADNPALVGQSAEWVG